MIKLDDYTAEVRFLNFEYDYRQNRTAKSPAVTIHNHYNFPRNKTRNRGSESQETLFRVKIPTALQTPQFFWEVVECYYGYLINSVIGGFN